MPKREVPLTALNRVYQTIGSVLDVNSCDVLTLDGRLDTSLLREAARRALAKHPPMTAHLVQRPWRGDLWRVPDEELPVDLRLHRLETTDPKAIDDHLMGNIWDEPLPLYTGRPVRFHLTETPRRSYLQVIHTHTYADARSCFRIVHDVATAYTALEAGEPFDDRPIDLTDRSLEGLFGADLTRREKAKYYSRALWLNAKDLLTPDRGLALPAGPPGPRRIHPHVFTPECTAHMVRCGRAWGSSLHGLLRLAYLRAGEAFNRERGKATRKLRIWDLFSLRRMLRESADDVYDSLVVPFPVDLDSRWSDAEALREASAQVRQLRDGDAYAHAYRLHLLFLLAAPVLPERWLELGRESQTRSNVYFTNPGVYPYELEAFGSVAIEDYYTFPQLFPPGKVLFIFTTFRGSLRIHALHDTTAFPDGFEVLLDPFLEELDRIVAATPGLTAGEQIDLSRQPRSERPPAAAAGSS